MLSTICSFPCALRVGEIGKSGYQGEKTDKKGPNMCLIPIRHIFYVAIYFHFHSFFVILPTKIFFLSDKCDIFKEKIIKRDKKHPNIIFTNSNY